MDASALSPADQRRRTRLRKMKGIALSLLIAAAITFVISVQQDQSGIWGWVTTMSEAAMVGALADWFAVTALFRHPLGIPIPHTAIIPRKKDDLAGSLESFFADNFLTEDIVSERILDAGIAGKAGGWLTDPDHARRVAKEASRIAAAALTRVDDEQVRALASDVLLPKLADRPLAPTAGALLSAVVEDGGHQSLVDIVAREIHTWLKANPAKFIAMLNDRAPRWSPDFLNKRVVSALYWQALDWAEKVRDQRDHPTRQALDDLLRRMAADLQADTTLQQRAEELKHRMLTHPQVAETAVEVWRGVRSALGDALANPDSSLHTRTIALVQQFGESLQQDAALRARADRMLADAAGFLVRTYGRELSSVVSHTIRRWDGEQASRRIELYVGRDLQFIRINGTVVGALAGLAIHAIGVLIA